MRFQARRDRCLAPERQSSGGPAHRWSAAGANPGVCRIPRRFVLIATWWAKSLDAPQDISLLHGVCRHDELDLLLLLPRWKPRKILLQPALLRAHAAKPAARNRPGLRRAYRASRMC